MAGAAAAVDCVLTVTEDDRVRIETTDGTATASSNEVAVLIDPFGTAFDSGTGEPVGGVTVTVVDADTGRPAEVFGDDGRSAYPSTVRTGESVTDAGGARYVLAPGDYRFPLLRPGRYRLRDAPPGPYTAPSTVARAALALLRQPGGQP